MKNFIKSEWLRLILIAMYMIIVIHCAVVGNTLALIGWGTGAAILVIGMVASHFYYRTAAQCVKEAESSVVIEIHKD